MEKNKDSICYVLVAKCKRCARKSTLLMLTIIMKGKMELYVSVPCHKGQAIELPIPIPSLPVIFSL